MKSGKRLISLVLVVLAVIALFGCASKGTGSGVAAQTLSYNGVKAKIFRYTPSDFEFRGNNTPVLIVLSDGAFTKETADACLNGNGFREIADKESCSVIFVNPGFDGKWTDEDYPVLQLVSSFASDTWYPNTNYASGMNKSHGMYCAGRFRHYYFAEGSAVDFAKANLDREGATYPMPEWGARDAGGFGAGFIYAESGFTAENVQTGFEDVCHTNRIYLNEGESFLTEYVYWEEYGITETVKSYDSKHFGTIEYYEYAPEGVDVNSASEKYPLVAIFHGAGMHPQAYAQNSAWPLLAAEHGFIVISVAGPYKANKSSKITDQMTADTHDLICDYIANHAVDASRVYATGFSMGGARSMALGSAYPETFAAIAPCDPVLDMFGTAPELKMPTFFLGGQYDFYNIFPTQNDWCGPMIEKLAQCNGFAYHCDKSIEGLWGCSFDRDTAYVAKGQLATVNVHEILSEDGNCYTKLCDVSHMSHNVLPYASTLIWEFFSQFSRAEDGSIVIANQE